MRELTKWPRLLVVGQPVTRQQANEILVRTNYWYLSTNDHEWRREVYYLIDMPTDTYGRPSWQDVEAFHKSINVLDLEYLGNRQIASSWIGGPHGWCDWNGGIGCATWNIGKWPSHEQVESEWREIATAFPYLDLKAQLVPDEGEAALPAVEYVVERGKVTTYLQPNRFITSSQELPVGAMLSILGGVQRERGVTLERLREALDQVRNSK